MNCDLFEASNLPDSDTFEEIPGPAADWAKCRVFPIEATEVRAEPFYEGAIEALRSMH